MAGKPKNDIPTRVVKLSVPETLHEILEGIAGNGIMGNTVQQVILFIVETEVVELIKSDNLDKLRSRR